MVRNSLVFALNGERVELNNIDPQTTVLNYIRNEAGLKGTKRGCGEGGCGSCVVLLSKYDPKSKTVEEYTINSCLAPICSIDGCAITTTEGLTNGRKEPHAVHTRLAGFHASQCGFCTPGMAISIYAGLKNSSRNCEVEGGGPSKLSVDHSQNFVAGNLCRCTGYRPLVDVCKSFAGDVDIEDLGINTFWKSNEHADKDCLNVYEPEKDLQFPSFLENQTGDFLELKSVQYDEERMWRSARTLSELFSIYQVEKNEKRNVHFVVGNTSSGIYKDFKPTVYIDISKIPELQSIVITDWTLEVGAAVTLNKLIGVLDARGGVVFPELAKHIRQVANQHVRNRASIGGNLMMSQQLGFASDIATILLGAGAQVTLVSAKDSTIYDMEKFLVGPSQTNVLQSIRIPSWAKFSKDEREKAIFRTYRASPRANGNAVSSINAGFLAVVRTESQVEKQKPTNRVQQLRLAFGALGGFHAIRAQRTEKFLIGKYMDADVLNRASRTLREEILSLAKDDELHTADYRASVAVGFLFQFFSPILPTKVEGLPNDVNGVSLVTDAKSNGYGVHGVRTENGHEANGLANGVTNGSTGRVSNGTAYAVANKDTVGKSVVRVFGSEKKSGKVTMGKQVFAASSEFYPVSQPTGKIAAHLQASGEAVYTDDIPAPPGTLYGALVLSQRALAKIMSVDASHALSSPGVKTLLTSKDIPEGGSNVGVNLDSMFKSTERLFTEDKVEYAGDILGVLIADTEENALQAAKKVKVEYDDTALEAPMLTIEDGVARKLFKETAVFGPRSVASVGDELLKGEFRIENAEVSTGGQYYFYMEPQTTLAVPDEDNCITIYAATQSAEQVQYSISKTLGIPMHNVRVITRRLGGAFGGKNIRNIPGTSACAVAAFVLKKPVRLTLDRNTDMATCGGRHETNFTYSVEFNRDGKITAVDSKAFMNGGWGDDYLDLVAMTCTKASKAYNWTSFRHTSRVVRTNLPTRSTMRAPGEIQGCFISESIIEHVASFLRLDSTEVREKNMHTHESATKFFGAVVVGEEEASFTLPAVWQRLKASAKFEARRLDIQQFNKESRWKKRGIAMMPLLYVVMGQTRLGRVSLYQDSSVVVEVGGTEMGQGLFTKVQQATAYGLSQLWEEHFAGKVDMSKIRIVQNDSISLPNGGATNGGTTSEGSCDAVIEACKILVERLKPISLEIKQQKGGNTPSWEEIVLTAKFSGVKLSAESESRGSGPTARPYLATGACVSEVEVDVLTGAVTILQTDLLYDCGKSLNPAVDIGQIEGSFVQGIGFYVTEEIKWDKNGVLITNGTWTYKPPNLDNIPRQFNVELLDIADSDRILSSKTAGEPPLLLATSVHSAIRDAIRAARADLKQLSSSGPDSKQSESTYFRMDSSASMEKVKALCGLYNVEEYLDSLGTEC